MPTISSSGAVCSCVVERMPCNSRPPDSSLPKNEAPILAMMPSKALEPAMSVKSASRSAGVPFSLLRTSRMVTTLPSVDSKCSAMPRTRFFALSVQ